MSRRSAGYAGARVFWPCCVRSSSMEGGGGCGWIQKWKKWNNGIKRKDFPEKSNPTVREYGRTCPLFGFIFCGVTKIALPLSPFNPSDLVFMNTHPHPPLPSCCACSSPPPFFKHQIYILPYFKETCPIWSLTTRLFLSRNSNIYIYLNSILLGIIDCSTFIYVDNFTKKFT